MINLIECDVESYFHSFAKDAWIQEHNSRVDAQQIIPLETHSTGSEMLAEYFKYFKVDERW